MSDQLGTPPELFDVMNVAMRSPRDAAGKTEWDTFLQTYVLDDLPAVVKLLVALHGWASVKGALLDESRIDGAWPEKRNAEVA